jgi:E3 ubiquitin-protein ligase RNF115/126
MGGRFTFTSGNLRPRTDQNPMTGGPPVEDLATYASPPSSTADPNGRSLYLITIRGSPDHIARMLGNIFGQIGPPPGEGREGGMGAPPGLQGLFASLLNPANARHGDAVYTQEALDQIISNLMEQHPTSNAPGPASPSAIQALPKKNLNEELLGPEGKGECSVCMDDVHIGDEVVMLPCSHWFHETCASAWLSEHNTCPICRKGIDGDSPPNASRRSSRTPSSPSSRATPSGRRLSLGSRLNRDNILNRNEARLDSIRASGRISPPPRRHRESNRRPRSGDPEEDLPPMPGSYRRRESDVSLSANHRDGERRGNTSGSDQSRDSRRSSRSTADSSGNGGAGGGPLSWLRDRFSSHPSGRRQDER